MRIELTEEEFRKSYDWKYIFGDEDDYHDSLVSPPTRILGDTQVSVDGFAMADVVEVLGLVEGENDGPDWVGVFKLADGRYIAVNAGCDYTGWG